MRKLFLVISFAVIACACSRGPAYHGAVKDLIPAQVGDFKLKGEPTKVAVVPDNPEAGLRPSEGLIAHYESTAATSVTLQVLNYYSAADAETALKEMRQNIQSQGKAKLTEGSKGTNKTLVIENFAPGFDAIMWANSSLLYQISGTNHQALLDFQRQLP